MNSSEPVNDYDFKHNFEVVVNKEWEKAPYEWTLYSEHGKVIPDRYAPRFKTVESAQEFIKTKQPNPGVIWPFKLIRMRDFVPERDHEFF